MPKIKTLSLVSMVFVMAATFAFASQAIAKNGQENRLTAEEHRSVVATFVQSLLQTASSTEKGLGEQVRTIAKEQNNADETTVEAIKKVESRSKIKTFLIGSDYKNLGALRSELVKTQNRLDQLKRLTENLKTQKDKTGLQDQIQSLEQEQAKVENFIKSQEGKFSLFGWLIKLFNK